ncbi:MAG: hypothetical protein WA174_13005, partial [Rhodoferax sp.]
MKLKPIKLVMALTSATVLALAGCGGGGGGSSSSGSSPTINLNGVAATGAPMANVSIKLTDALGASKTATTDAAGNYTMDVSGMTAPFVVVASGMAGDGTETLVSVVASQPTAGQTVVANVTPLTNALAATLDSTGDPLHLAANVATEATNITPGALATATTNLQTALAPLLTQVGASTTTNFISGVLTANGTGLDKLLDSVQIAVAPGGTANGGITVAIKDGNGTVTTSALSLATTPAALPTLTVVADYSVVNTAQAGLTACFAVTPGSNRPTASECTSLVTADYLNDGKTAAQEFGQFTAAAFDSATAERPEIIRFIDATHAVVKLVLDLTNGQHYALTTVAENSALTGNTWKLRGNQRNYFTFVNGVAERRNELNAAATLPSGYTAGLNLYFDATAGNAATLFGNANSYVKVTGPGIPVAGVILKPSLGTCAYLTITSETGNTAAAQKNTCSSYFRLTGVAQNAANAATFDTAFTAGQPNHNQNYRVGKVSDATLLGIHPFDAYTFTIHDGAAGTDSSITEWLRARPLTTAELPYVRWNALSAGTLASLDPNNAAAFTGGASMPVSWTPQPLTAPVTVVNAQVRSGGVL